MTGASTPVKSGDGSGPGDGDLEVRDPVPHPIRGSEKGVEMAIELLAPRAREEGEEGGVGLESQGLQKGVPIRNVVGAIQEGVSDEAHVRTLLLEDGYLEGENDGDVCGVAGQPGRPSLFPGPDLGRDVVENGDPPL